MTHSSHPFPAYLLNEIQQYPGNDHCCDCSSLDTAWASVSHGTLICLECAGKHRSLGVSASFVRSINMDTWSKRQLEMMRQGGNGQIKRFFKRLEVFNSHIQELYSSRGADHYRKKLEERVDKITSGEIKSHVRIFRKVRSTSTDSHKSVEELSKITASNIYSVSFGLGPLGITLTKDYNAEAVISKVALGSAAAQAGIMVGDYVKGVAGIFSDKYDEIMSMITAAARPFTILLLRCSPCHYADYCSPKASPKKVSSIEEEESRQQQLDDELDLTEEDVEVGSEEQLQGLEMSVSDMHIRHISSFMVSAPELSAMTNGCSSSSSVDASAAAAALAIHLEDEDEEEQWVEEETLQADGNSTSSMSIEALLLADHESHSPPTLKVPPKGITLTVMFDEQPLGFTLTSSSEGRPEVLRLKDGGRAMRLGVNVSDVLVAVDSTSIAHYHQAMEQLSIAQLPLRLTFYRASFQRYHSEPTGAFKSSTGSGKVDHMVGMDDGGNWVLKRNLSFSNALTKSFS